MKTPVSQPTFSRRPALRLPRHALIVCSLVASLAAAEPVAEPKTHSLFVGGKLLVEVDGTAREVVGVTRDAYCVDVLGERKLVPLRDPGTVRIDQTLQISNATALVENLKWSATHERDSADSAAWADQAQNMMTLQSNALLRSDRGLASAVAAGEIKNDHKDPGSPFRYAAAQATLNEAGSQVAVTQVMNHQAGQLMNRLGQSQSPDVNAIEISFAISAPKPAKEAYLLVVTTYREDGKAEPQYRTYVEPLAGLGPKEKTVQFTQAGFAPGFSVEAIAVHLYADGQEIATNLSERRVELTEDAALRYLTVCYVAAHPKETLAAVPQRVALPVGFREAAPVGSVSRPVYATVAPDGSVKQVAADEAGTATPDPYIESVVRKFRFNPALKEGKPVESVVALTLSDYLL